MSEQWEIAPFSRRAAPFPKGWEPFQVHEDTVMIWCRRRVPETPPPAAPHSVSTDLKVVARAIARGQGHDPDSLTYGGSPPWHPLWWDYVGGAREVLAVLRTDLAALLRDLAAEEERNPARQDSQVVFSDGPAQPGRVFTKISTPEAHN